MKNFTLKGLVLTGLLLFSLSSFSQTYILDWGSSFGTWANGQTSGTANAVGGSTINVGVSMAFTGTGANNANYPAVNVDNTDAGALFEVQGSTDNINIRQNLANKTSFQRVTFTFSSPVQNISFGIADIDANGAGPAFTYLDNIVVTGTGPMGTVIPTCAKYNAASTIVSVTGNNAYANDGAGAGGVASLTQNSADQDGTVFYTFSGNAITSITIDYGVRNIASVQADPDQQFMAIGNLSFQRAIAPTTATINNLVMPNTNPATGILALSATDDESISSYTIVTIPTVAQGVLSYFNGTAYVAATASLTLTPAQAASLRFDPDINFIGNASFTYSATDNRGLVSNTSTVNLPVEPIPAPLANNIIAPIENNNQGATPIPALSASVTTGTINSYVIQTIPAPAQGVLTLCDPTCTAVIAGQTITAAQKDKLRFDPAATYIGTATFTYTAISDLGISSNTATYAIPVKNDPPIADNILARPVLNTAPSAAIPALNGSDPDGIVNTFTITTIPSAASGVLYYCNGACVAVTAPLSVPAANADKFQFDPAAAFTGYAVFNYTSTDNNANVSPVASYTMPVRGTAAFNLRPLANNVVAPNMSNANAATLIPALVASDADGTIAQYTIETIPSPAQGTLSYCNNGTEPCTGTITPIAGVVNLTAAQMSTLKFDPLGSFAGTASFTYSATDNSGNKSNIASYTIPVTNTPPVANPITTPPMNNGNAQTVIPGLSGHDDGSVASYTVTSLPVAAAGILYYYNGTSYVTVASGQVLTPAQAALLRFDPTAAYTGNGVFNYTSTDNNGLVSQPAVYTIPVTGAAIPAGVSPVADHKTAPAMPNTNAATAIPAISGSDPDGTIISYTINSIPAASEGVLTLCNPGCAAVTPGQVIALADVANLRFDPTAGFEGNAIFDYTSRDNSGKLSNVATYTIPVTGTAPRAINVVTTTLFPSSPQTPIASLAGSDPDGAITSYTITSIPPVSSGVLFFCNPTCIVVTPGLVIPAADAAKLQFDPAAGYKGVYTAFNYIATDNTGKTSNTATFNIPLANGSTLPVSLLEFKGVLSNAVVKLSWTTASELNSAYFDVEYSVDGSTFTTIGKVQAAGNSSNVLQYSFDHQQPTAINYYRLKMVDADGQFKYSQVIVIRLSNSNVVMQAFPNPFTDKINITIKADSRQLTTIQLLDVAGRQIRHQQIIAEQGLNSFTMNALASLGKGVYIVRVTNEEASSNIKFVKE